MIFRNIYFLTILNVFPSLIHAQGIEIAPMVQNPLIQSEYREKSNTIDSTFIFSTDTISIPFFDNFTTNQIQEYTRDNLLSYISIFLAIINLAI